MCHGVLLCFPAHTLCRDFSLPRGVLPCFLPPCPLVRFHLFRATDDGSLVCAVVLFLLCGLCCCFFFTWNHAFHLDGATRQAFCPASSFRRFAPRHTRVTPTPTRERASVMGACCGASSVR